MAQVRNRVRSARATSKTLSNADLHEIARRKTSIQDFVTEHPLRAKSEVGVDQAVREAKREGRKQAWAPTARHSLSSNSATFQHTASPTLPPHPNTRLRSPEHDSSKDRVLFLFSYCSIQCLTLPCLHSRMMLFI